MKENTSTWMPSDGSGAIEVQSYRLVIQSEEGQSQAHVFESRLVSLGSAPDCDVFLDDVTVSRAHAMIEVDNTGHRIRDLGSKNGTWVNGVRVTDAYKPNDAHIRLGGLELSFSLESKRVEIPISGRNSFGGMIYW